MKTSRYSQSSLLTQMLLTAILLVGTSTSPCLAEPPAQERAQAGDQSQDENAAAPTPANQAQSVQTRQGPAQSSQAAAEQKKEGECTCGEIRTVTSARELSEAVFSGRVLSIRRTSADISEVTFQVLQYWRGKGMRTITLTRSESYRTECNYPFEKGLEYLVFVDQSSLDVYRNRFLPSARPIFNATKCNRTKLLKDATRELDVLGLGEFAIE